MFRRWCAVGFVIGLLLGASQSVYGQFSTLTVSKLAGIRVSAENPPAGLSITSGLVLGLGADLLALGGDVTIQQLASDLAKGATIESQSGGNLTSGTYCYLLTTFVDNKEIIQGAGASQISVGSGQQVVFRWQVADELRQVVQFGGKAGYRIYRFGPLPANTQCTAVQLGQYGRLGELELAIPPPASLSFTDDGRRSIGGAPQLKAGGNLSVDGNAVVKLNLTVGALAQVGSLQVGAAPAAPGPGNVWIAGWLRMGNFAAPPGGVTASGTIYFDTNQDALCVLTAKSGWQCLNPAVIINVLINNPTFIQNVINLLIQNNTFIQNLVIAVGGNVTFQQTILQQLIQSVEFRQTIVNILIANVEFRQAIINLLVVDERFKTLVIQAIEATLRPSLDSRYVLKPRDETDLTIGSLMSLGQLAGDWLVVGEPKDNTNFWALINPDNGPDLALGTVEPPNLSELKLSVMEFERSSGLVRIVKDLEVGGTLTIKGSLTLEDLEVNRDLRVLGFTDVGNVRGRDAEFDNLILNRDLRVRGVKFFIEQHPTDPTKEIAYAALEGPEAGTYIRGSAELKDGQAVIALPEHFALVTSEEGLTVQLTPIGEWLQLYIVELSPRKLVVREAQGKSGKFFYLVQGVRRGYEQLPVIQEKQKEP